MDCSVCHVSGDWHTIKDDFEFDHEKETGVPLNGAHAQASCLMCHNDRGDAGTFAARGCAGCHEDIHRGAMGQNCSDCHNEQSWRPQDSIAQHNRTRFPLVGAHAAAACFTCHEGAQVGNFEGLDVSCETCHQDDLARALNPDHAALNLTSDCQRCHVPTTWNAAAFAHPPSFPLVGGHGGIGCATCHGEGPYVALPTDCASCHLDDYQQTTDPNHALAGFGTNCEDCHTIYGWGGAEFNHPWPLTGAHASASCSDCHEGGVYSGLSTDCASCHLQDYQQTTDPNHALAGFGTNCQTCHNTSSWEGATFNHSFPITSGPHAGISCATCHTNPSAPSEFNCITCHTEGQTGDDHSEVPAYVWSSPACYECHPNGRSRRRVGSARSRLRRRWMLGKQNQI
jgi:hypothetical protein